MARPRAFDLNRFLDQAMEIFWLQGYAATSMSDIYTATGVGAGSVYALFKDKAELFRSVFERYSAAFRATMPDGASGVVALESWLSFLAGYLADDPFRKGCLIANTLMERHAHSPETVALTDHQIAAVRTFFKRNIDAAKRAGDVEADVKSKKAADALLATTLGMMSMARAGTGRDVLHGIALGSLEPLRTSLPRKARRRSSGALRLKS